MSGRKFYTTKIEVEILSDYPYTEDDLRSILFDVERGDVVLGEVYVPVSSEVSGHTMVSLLLEAGETPLALGLDDDGTDVGYDEED